ncbi:PH domain-containing protein [Candidatus Daviesbacteria bacterium]|nr:PH domain-containing protein [Candidatus Daviesbacteria bacterium]
MHLRFFPSFFDHPINVRFAEQEVDETIEILLRQHFITNIPWIVASFVGFFVPFILLSIDRMFGFDFLDKVSLELNLMALILWYLFLLAYIIENFLHWYFNIYIITNRHLVDINFHSLLLRDILEVGIENVETASSKIQGIIRSLFNYGDVTVRTAAEASPITFDAVPFPDKVADRINDIRGQRVHR